MNVIDIWEIQSSKALLNVNVDVYTRASGLDRFVKDNRSLSFKATYCQHTFLNVRENGIEMYWKGVGRRLYIYSLGKYMEIYGEISIWVQSSSSVNVNVVILSCSSVCIWSDQLSWKEKNQSLHILARAALCSAVIYHLENQEKSRKIKKNQEKSRKIKKNQSLHILARAAYITLNIRKELNFLGKLKKQNALDSFFSDHIKLLWEC